MLSSFRSCLILSFSALLVFGFNACDGFQANSFGSASFSALTGPVDGISLITTLQDTSMNLAEEKEVTLTVASQEGYAGTVNLSIDRTALDQLDTLNAVELGLNRISVDLAAGSSEELTLTIRTKSSAPSFDLTQFKIVAQAADEKSTPKELEHGISVNPVVELKMFGELANRAARFDKPEEMEFAVHQQGLTVRFINMDQESGHIIHGNRSIPHGDRQNPLAASVDGVQPGGIYTVNVAADERRSGGYYYHDFENGGAERTMLFNRTAEELQNSQQLRALASVTGVEKLAPFLTEEEESKDCHGGKHDTD